MVLSEFFFDLGLRTKIFGSFQGSDGLDLFLDIRIEKILFGRCYFGAQALLLKRWSVEFDATIERLEITLVWFHLLDLPLIFCSDEVFMKIGKTIGFFYESDRSFLSSRYKGMLEFWWDSSSLKDW
jgi:hypothetical protein